MIFLFLPDDPVVKSIGSTNEVSLMLADSTTLTCTAEGSPVPTYRWIQVTKEGEVLRSDHRTLELSSVSFKDQGVYVCEARNVIKGEVRIAKSETLNVEVAGSPVVDAQESNHFVHTGSDAKVQIEFCADPQPQITWVRQGQEQVEGALGYSVGELEEGSRPDCYTSTLTVNNPSKADHHEYLLKLKNNHGEETHRVVLRVGEVFSQETLIGGLVGGGVTVVVMLLVLGCWCRRCCNNNDKKIKQDIER